MKKSKSTLISFGFIISVIFIATGAFAEIRGSKHDFSTQGWNSSGRICIVCHTPHNANTSVAEAPLWNHTVSTATYTLYTSPTLDTTLNQPSASSKLCLSCHDGTVALDSYGGNVGTNFMTTGPMVGANLSNDHPISFVYDTNLATQDGELRDPSTTLTSLGGTIERDMLFNGQVQCASCHDVHNTVSQGNSSLLVINNTGSALCLTCHRK